MKILKRFFLILLFIFILIYVTNITSIPNKIILFKGEELELKTMLGIYIDNNTKNDKAIQTGAINNSDNISEITKVSLKVFNLIKVKEIEVNTIPKTKVVPLGNSARIKTVYKWCTSSWYD